MEKEILEIEGEEQELFIKTTDLEYSIDAEVDITVIGKNKMSGTVTALAVTPEKKVLNDIVDTYVKESMPYLSFNRSQVLNTGNNGKEDFITFIKSKTFKNECISLGVNFLSAKLYLKLNYGKIGNIGLHPLNEEFSDFNVSYLNYPSYDNSVAASIKYDSARKLHYFDISDYAKGIISGTVNDKGFAMISDLFTVFNSIESTLNKPFIEIEYTDPDKFYLSDEIDASVKVKFINNKPLNAEIKFNDQLPKIDAECTFSRTSVGSEISVLFTNSIDAEMGLMFTNNVSDITASCIFSKTSADASMKIKYVDVLEAEVSYRPPEEFTIDADVDIRFSDFRPASMELVFGSNIDADINFNDTTRVSLMNSELTFLSTGNESVINSDVELLFGSDIDASLCFLKEENNVIDSEITLMRMGKETIDAETKVAFGSNINAETTLKKTVEETIDASVAYRINSKSEINAEMGVLYVSKMDAETSFRKILQSELDSEVCVMVETKSELDVEINMHKLYLSTINSDVDLRFASNIDAEMKLLKAGKTSIDADVEFNRDIRARIRLIELD